MTLNSLINFAKDGVSRFRKPTIEVVDSSIDKLIDEIEEYNPNADFELLNRCYEYGEKQHEDQMRESDEPYFVHCAETAETLIDLNMDIHTICSGLLHDTIEDTQVTRDELAQLFDGKIADLVEGVTKIGSMHFQENSKWRQAENYRKMLLAMAEDVRVIIIKLADRLHNMRTLEYLDKEKRNRIATETLEIYAPLAHRLGMAQIKCELEDLAFKYLNPKEYKEVAELVDETRAEREKYIAKMAKKIKKVLKEKGLSSVVFGRAKHLYSIYQKIQKKGVSFKDICDLIAFRVLVAEIGDCYVVLGALHENWKHIHERVKDFIGQPKTNGYRSLHTTIIDEGRPVEVQIRTFDMHQVAEKGIAAHWRYKEGIPAKSKDTQPFVWFREFIEHIQELNEPDQFLQSMKDDLFPNEVYVFTPKGDVIALSAGSTPVDFAYKIHTEIGNTCVGAEVNGRIVTLRYSLQNGDRVKVLTEKNATPSRDWINFVKTSRARNKIRRWLKKQERTQNLEIGRQLLEAEFRRRHIDPKPQMQSEDLLIVAEAMELHSIEELLVQIGYGDISAQHVINLIFPPEEEHEEEADSEELPEEEKTGKTVSIAGIDQTFARIAGCCNPIPGDDVVGFLTRGRGVSIHKVNCDRIKNESERLVQLNWNSTEDITYPVEIWIESSDRKGLLSDVSAAISKEDVNIKKGNFGRKNPTTSYQRMVISVTGRCQLNRVIRAIERVRGVKKVMKKGEKS